VPISHSAQEADLIARSDEFDIRRDDDAIRLSWSGCSLALEIGTTFSCRDLIAFGRTAYADDDPAAVAPSPDGPRSNSTPSGTPIDLGVVWQAPTGDLPRRVMATISETTPHTLAVSALWERGRAVVLRVTEGSGVLHLTARYPSADQNAPQFIGTLLRNEETARRSNGALLAVGPHHDARFVWSTDDAAAPSERSRVVVAGILSLPATVAALRAFDRNAVDPHGIVELDAKSH